MYFLLPLSFDEIENSKVGSGKESGPGMSTQWWRQGGQLGPKCHDWCLPLIQPKKKCFKKKWLNK